MAAFRQPCLGISKNTMQYNTIQYRVDSYKSHCYMMETPWRNIPLCILTYFGCYTLVLDIYTTSHELRWIRKQLVTRWAIGLGVWHYRGNRNRYLQTSKAPLKSQVQDTSLFTSVESNQRGCPKNSQARWRAWGGKIIICYGVASHQHTDARWSKD